MAPNEATSEPDTWTCNACGYLGPSSNEHLLHVAIGRVILGNAGLTRDEVRAGLQSEHFRGYGLYAEPTASERLEPGWANTEIYGLICEECNQRWANRLELDAGKALYGFIIGGEPADAILRRWAWYFATKLWWTHKRTEGLASGPLLPLLSKIAEPRVNIPMGVHVVRLPVDADLWNFAANFRGWAGIDERNAYIPWVIRGVAMMVVASASPTIYLPIPRSTNLTEGLRLRDVPMLAPDEIRPLFAAPAVVPRPGSSA